MEKALSTFAARVVATGGDPAALRTLSAADFGITVPTFQSLFTPQFVNRVNAAGLARTSSVGSTATGAPSLPPSFFLCCSFLSVALILSPASTHPRTHAPLFSDTHSHAHCLCQTKAILCSVARLRPPRAPPRPQRPMSWSSSRQRQRISVGEWRLRTQKHGSRISAPRRS